METEALGALEKQLGCQDAEHVARRFLGEPKFQGRFFLLFFQPAADSCLTGIVTGRHRHPVPIFGIRFPKILAGGFGSLFCMIAFIYLIPYLQAVMPPGGLGKLPESGGTRTGKGLGVQVALNGAEIFQILRNPLFSQDGYNLGEHPFGALEHQDRIGVHVGERQQLAVHPLDAFGGIDPDGIARKNDIGRDFRCRHMELIYRLGSQGDSRQKQKDR